MEKEKNYDYGIDVLKIVATCMIIAMHILLQGGILRNAELGSSSYYIGWIVECLCYIGVNLYALETGYLNAKREIKRRKLAQKWLQVFFYSMFFTALFAILMPGTVGVKEWIKGAMPVLFNEYWYFTQYFVLFMIMPYVNKMMAVLTKEDFKKLVLTIVFVLSFLPTIRQVDLFATMNGYSGIWLLGLYIIGGYIAHYKDEIKLNKKFLAASIGISCIITVGLKFVIDALTHSTTSVFLYNYTSVTMVVSSIAMFLLVTNIKVNRGQKIIKFVSKTTFGIYLFHVNYFIWIYIMADLFTFMIGWNPLSFILGLIGFDLVIFVIGMAFEFLRQKFFEVAHIDQLANWCGFKMGIFLDNLSKKL